MTRLNILFFLFFFSFTPLTQAADSPADFEKLDAQAESLMKGLDAEGVRQFSVIRTGHGTLRAVEDVQTTLNRGITSCRATNKDMDKDLTTAWNNWQDQVKPALKSGHARLGQLIGTQKFTKPKTIKDYLASFDAVIKQRQQGVNEVPVSSASACKDLIKNLGDTQTLMPKIINETLGLK